MFLETPSDSDEFRQFPDKVDPWERGQPTQRDSRPLWKRVLTSDIWTPTWCRHNPDKPFVFTISLMLLCALTSAVTAANLNYIYPILNKAADDFGITYQTASIIPQLLKAGYGIGLLLFCPMGDVVRLRPFILLLSIVTTVTWLGLCLAKDFKLFAGLSFVAGLVTVSPQILVPLIGGLAPPERRATAVSIVVGGLMMGIAISRVVAGIVTEYTHWRNIYWAALGLQVVLLLAMWLGLPDFPPVEKRRVGDYVRKYLRILWGMAVLTVTKPMLAYGCAVTFLTNGALASYWTVITAHLADSPRNFSPLQVGLYFIIAIGTTVMIPIYSYFVIERSAPYVSSTIGLVLALVTIALDAYAGNKLGNTKGLVGAVLQAVGIDWGTQVASVAYRVAVYEDMPRQTNRANVVFSALAFFGQLAGTGVGNAMYAGGGWTRLGTFHIAVVVATLVVVFARGPREKRWFGWKGGASMKPTRFSLNVDDNSGAEKSGSDDRV
ncbi:putative transporter [Podospora australis]|uniref:Transporter n=1 Tax=Podospora australis TaxID=1536484 RepID=A0AAN6WT28_9PEZI|nr:putative transporter [Podospora australis]